MGYVGNPKGPRESIIIDSLGFGFFGISGEALESDISYHRLAESRNEVVPVRLDENRRPYIKLSGPKIGVIRFFLHENGYELSGDVLVRNEKGDFVTESI